jgi:hypothetical protein
MYDSRQNQGGCSTALTKPPPCLVTFGGDVNRLQVWGTPTALFLPFVVAGIATASPDPRLLSLVPPGAQLVAGISSSSIQRQPNNFVLVTSKNKVDLADFYALTGGDETRLIHQVIFVALSDGRGSLSEHSLLVSGHFDRSRLFKSATDAGATVSSYRGIPVAEIQPFGREKERFNEVRLLAILDSNVLLFGSIDITRLELDRFLSHSHADETILHRYGHLRSKDQTWCLLAGSISSLSFPAEQEDIRQTLAAVNLELANEAMSAEKLEFGLFYGRKVEFEYSLSRSSIGNDESPTDSFEQSMHEPAVSPTALLPALNMTGDTNTVHAVIAIPVPRFEEWLAKISNRR